MQEFIINVAKRNTENNEVSNVNMEKVNTVINNINHCGVYNDFLREVLHCNRKDEKFNLGVLYSAIFRLIDIFDNTLNGDEKQYVFYNLNYDIRFNFKYKHAIITEGTKPYMRGDRKYYMVFTFKTKCRIDNEVNKLMEAYFYNVRYSEGYHEDWWSITHIDTIKRGEKAGINCCVMGYADDRICEYYEEHAKDGEYISALREFNVQKSGLAYVHYSFNNAELFEEAVASVNFEEFRLNDARALIRFASQQDGSDIMPANEEETEFSAEICIEAVLDEDKVNETYYNAFLAACKELAEDDAFVLDKDGCIVEPNYANFKTEEEYEYALYADSDALSYAMGKAQEAVIKYFGAMDFDYTEIDVRYGACDFIPMAEEKSAIVKEEKPSTVVETMNEEETAVNVETVKEETVELPVFVKKSINPITDTLVKDVRNIIIGEYGGHIMSEGRIVVENLKQSSFDDIANTVVDLAHDEYALKVKVDITKETVVLSGGQNLCIIGDISIDVLGMVG